MFQKKNYINILFILLIVACNPKSSFDVDISKIEDPNINVKRYENALMSISLDSIRIELESLRPEFPFFIGDKIDTFDIVNLINYITDPTIIRAHNDINNIYPDLKSIEKDLNLAFRYLKYYYPDFVFPEVYSYISGFDFENPIKYINNVIVIGLDNYLESDYYIYPMIGVPEYKTYRMRKQSIIVDCMTEIAKSKLPILKGQITFLDKMIHEGKQLYFLDICLPFANDSLKIGFKKSQLEWCSRNENNIWGFFLEQNLLYSTDRKIMSRFMDDGPFTPSFSAESPARTGSFVGWQIVRSFMNNNKVSIEELMLSNDSQSILNKSKYKPKK